MPRGDGTGPMGLGPRTGRSAGYCAGSSTPGWTNVARAGWSGLRGLVGAGRWAAGALPRLGQGLGLGQGSGRGRNRRF
ncbi:MAG: DUF5320 domain-containing protein [Dehalococcoidales bacterium]|nr:DUF5320 domain-containing protein [Dehalococcoidales bacterium]